MRILNFSGKKPYPTDAELVLALQRRERTAETYFFEAMDSYYNRHFNDIHNDKQLRDDIFQNAIYKLWREIESKKIRVVDDRLARQQRDGSFSPMSASLSTFMLTFAKNELRELRKVTPDDDIDSLLNSVISGEPIDVVEDDRVQKLIIVDDCLHSMSPNCMEIITMSVMQGKSLDEIMAIRAGRNTSKAGLKSKKSSCMTTLRGKIIIEFKKFNLAY